MRDLPELTGLRGLAALWVLIYHTWVVATPRIISIGSIDLTPFFSCGWAGVQIFFVLSGFLLGLPYAMAHAANGARPEAIPFLTRRLARVFPAYYLQLGLLMLIYCCIGKADLIPSPDSLWRHMLMLFTPPPVGVQPLVGVWWTLPVELSFYLVLPALSALLAPGKIRYLCLLLIMIMPAWRHFTVVTMANAPMNEKVTMAVQLPGAIDSFGMGLLTAWMHVEIVTKQRFTGVRRFVTALGIPIFTSATVLIALLYWQHYNYKKYWTDSFIFYGWTPLLNLSVATLMLRASLGEKRHRPILAARPTVYLGTISYGVYLWHFPVIDWLIEQPPFREALFYRFPWLFIATLTITIPIAACSWEWVEKRVILYSRRSKRVNKNTSKAGTL